MVKFPWETKSKEKYHTVMLLLKYGAFRGTINTPLNPSRVVFPFVDKYSG